MRILRVCLKELLRGLNGFMQLKHFRTVPKLRKHYVSVAIIIIITNLFSLVEPTACTGSTYLRGEKASNIKVLM